MTTKKRLTPEEFKALQKEWYGRLKEDGFDDIERKIERHEDSDRTFERLHEIQRKAHEASYLLLAQKVLNPNTKYRSIADKLIMLWYAEGQKIKTMAADLALMGMPKERKTIRIIIRRYIMAWGIRKYTRKQLNLKDKE